ncbi:MAG: tol-pal system-associated acyl-CoA thioesterase [Cypionkella sp.]|uniref:tol-pal system-associated acyl-CoA thioesterase n=1 Tax=Cypionkella sp. TaxID=2811411 RepID=UPI002AB8BDF5|nr:tol-pal system-associated acyl-CoA thioesterase [Cypionkella sp.]MDZ4312370.1 tol-pal system-associated acyl-CoA thioesterase [Cypionkella sp.]
MHQFDLRVYYEDTDLAGIVYYANYLKFIERGRSEWVRALGVDQVALKAAQGLVFAVRRVEADYLRPAKFDDALAVITECLAVTGARIELRQQVLRDGAPLFVALVTLVCLTDTGQPARIPADIRAKLLPKRH